MKTIDLILSWIEHYSNEGERNLIRDKVQKFIHPPIEPTSIITNLLRNAKGMYIPTNNQVGGSKVTVVKYVKDVTGWGLKESKDWCDLYVFQN